MMKLWITSRHLLSPTNYHWNFPSNTLLTRHLLGIFISHPRHSRRTIRMTHPQHPRQQRLLLLHVHLSSHRPRTLLGLI
uniref:Uncharacterized protein n=1 Tax=Chelydra serpentina TaxID=8475 RepID=A0A8C3XRU7_CHESE